VRSLPACQLMLALLYASLAIEYRSLA